MQMKEKKEVPVFWTAIGGKKTYFQAEKPYTPKLFRTINSGVIDIDPVPLFSQDDLEEARVCLMDTLSKVYVWIGSHASSNESKIAMETAQRFVALSPNGHSPKASVLVCRQYREPAEFTSFFPAWSNSLFPESKKHLVPEFITLEEALKVYSRKEFSYDELLADPLPEGVNPTKLETYLSDEEFEEIFKLSRDEWNKLSDWKKEESKKQVYLY
eukprot:TRINITY_DN3155_c0_g2_i1.p1 TRINITY_DN3155_c0_g2~~TRINITY_DN3155_c0_g2_i1.p1  ORF type:complete len:247 (-),score=17.07 TRINITY_DN3155_c0_g2_i1:73-714(-)